MDVTSDRGKQPISAAMAGPYGHPFHPILVTVPIGAWAASLVFDIASHLVSAPAFLTAASTWLIGIGVVGAVAAALVGFLDLVAIPTGTPAFRVGLTHMSLNLAGHRGVRGRLRVAPARRIRRRAGRRRSPAAVRCQLRRPRACPARSVVGSRTDTECA